jgi:hypothetical protein
MKTAMRSILTIVFVAAASAASAHPSLVAHEHPHGANALVGLDALLLAALAASLAAATWVWTRARG